MRVAVTGAGGFVGRHFIERAAAAGWSVAAVLRSPPRTALPAGCEAVRVSGLVSAELAPAFEGARAVVHLAQIGSEKGGATYQGVNVEGTRQVVLAARQAGVSRLAMLSGLGVARYGQAPRTTNAYFCSKLAAEGALLQADGEAVVFRPSYIVGPGEGLLPLLLRQMRAGAVEQVEDGRHRMQPVAVQDAAEALLAALTLRPGEEAGWSGRPPHRVFDLVGPQPIAFRELVARVGAIARRRGLAGDFDVRSVPAAEADRQAAGGGWHGLPPDELDCLLCDEVAEPAPLQALLGRALTPVDAMLEAAVAALS